MNTGYSHQSTPRSMSVLFRRKIKLSWIVTRSARFHPPLIDKILLFSLNNICLQFANYISRLKIVKFVGEGLFDVNIAKCFLRSLCCASFCRGLINSLAQCLEKHCLKIVPFSRNGTERHRSSSWKWNYLWQKVRTEHWT